MAQGRVPSPNEYLQHCSEGTLFGRRLIRKKKQFFF